MPSNLFSRFKALIPTDPLLIGTVTEVTATGAVVELPGGAAISVRGSAAVDSTVFVQGGVIQSLAPSLPLVTGEV